MNSLEGSSDNPPKTPNPNKPNQDEAIQAVQEGMGKFLLQAARGLSFWNALGQRAAGAMKVG